MNPSAVRIYMPTVTKPGQNSAPVTTFCRYLNLLGTVTVNAPFETFRTGNGRLHEHNRTTSRKLVLAVVALGGGVEASRNFNLKLDSVCAKLLPSLKETEKIETNGFRYHP